MKRGWIGEDNSVERRDESYDWIKKMKRIRANEKW